jgi:molybdenum cofactor cytidylyltransferase
VKIEALVLAAGFSSRMPTNKMLLELAGRTVIQRTVDCVLASAVSGVHVVVGCKKELIKKELVNYNVNIIENSAYSEGMSTSIKAGVNHLMINGLPTDAIFIFLGDMPLIKSSTINYLLHVYKETGSQIVVPVYQGRQGHPVLFDKKLFNRLLKLTGDSGAKIIFQESCNDIYKVTVNDPAIHMDIDCWDDYLAIKKYYQENQTLQFS